ncbi:D-glycero-beta-D-manno-heptose 1-phosphate adenylyltransferase [bacterium]|nr:MAG: D-glycero-beta-D-manno-heptose 1-phosphate adenylyltransferase [bacterium]
MGKVVDRKEIEKICEEERKKGKKIVFTNGCFDLIHRGHIEYLKKAKSYGDVLVIGLNTDDSVRRIKGEKRPIIPENDRAFILSSFYFVDYVVLFDEDTPLNLILQVKPDVLVKGGDYKKHEIVGAREVEGWGGEVVIIPYIKGQSTSGIIERIVKRFCNE